MTTGEATIQRTVRAVLEDLALAEKKIDALRQIIEGLKEGEKIPMDQMLSIPVRGCPGVKILHRCDLTEFHYNMTIGELVEHLEKADIQIQKTREALEKQPPDQTFEVETYP